MSDGRICPADSCAMTGAAIVACAPPGLCRARELLLALRRSDSRRVHVDNLIDGDGFAAAEVLVGRDAARWEGAADGDGMVLVLTDRGGVL